MAKALTRGVPSKLGRGGTTYPLTETNSLSPGVAQEDVEVCVLGGGGAGGADVGGKVSSTGRAEGQQGRVQGQ